MLKRMGKKRIDGARAIIDLNVFKVGTALLNFHPHVLQFGWNGLKVALMK